LYISIPFDNYPYMFVLLHHLVIMLTTCYDLILFRKKKRDKIWSKSTRTILVLKTFTQLHCFLNQILEGLLQFIFSSFWNSNKNDKRYNCQINLTCIISIWIKLKKVTTVVCVEHITKNILRLIPLVQILQNLKLKWICNFKISSQLKI
jgi:hypothetical protein